MKKTVISLSLVLMLLLTACGHEHIYDTWNRDGENHWKTCQCGTAATKTPHDLEEGGFCDTCGAGISHYEDGTYSILIYDQQGAIASQTDYDVDGTVMSQMAYQTEYDENGNPKHQQVYYDGVLSSEVFYLPTTESEVAEVYVSEEIIYYEDCKYVSKYDEEWHLLSYTTYDLEGNVLSQDQYELEYDAYGNVVKTTCYTDGEISNVSQDLLGPDGTMHNVSNIYYEHGQVVYAVENVYEFDEFGQLILQQEYTDGILTHEIQYEGNMDDGYYMAYEASYDETGVLQWKNHYDTQGEIIEETP